MYHKGISITCFCILISLVSTAQTINYVRSWDVQKPITDATAISTASTLTTALMSTQYIDGIGRRVQTVSKGISPAGNDMVAPVVYDEFGREPYQYLPYVSGGVDGSYKSSPLTEQQSFYNDNNVNSPVKGQGETFYYAQTDYEPSPLNRVQKTFAPGNSWVGSRGSASEKSVQIQYGTNTTNEGVRKWTIAMTAGSLPASTATYTTGQLYKTTTIDEAGHQLIEYKDGQQRVILKKVQIANAPGTDHTGWLCTYYIYDDLDNLRFVMQPRAVEISSGASWVISQSVADELCFRYEYDSRHRMIIKKVPGAGEVWMVYDSRDRLVYTQDANMRTKNWWLAMLYDNLNRPVQTGMMTYTGDRTALQNYVSPLTPGSSTTSAAGTGISSVSDNLLLPQREIGRTSYQATGSIQFNDGFSSEDGASFTAEIVSSAAPAYSGTQVTNAVMPPTGSTYVPLTMTFYDDYSFTSKTYNNTNNGKLDIGTNDYGDALPASTSSLTKSLPTGTRVRVIENANDLTQGKWMETVSYYDDKGRLIQAQNDNYKGGLDITTIRYNFTGKPISVYMVHNNAGAGISNLTVKTNLNYGAAGRLLNIQKSINDGPAKTTVVNTYDELGQLKTKKLGTDPKNSANPLETLSYEYNIRGWLLGMNRSFAKSTSSTANYFGFDLGYDKTAIAISGGTAGSYATAQYNGNIEGMVWKSAGDGELRKYDYSYDNANRLTAADFNQYTGGSFNRTAKVDFSVSNLAYDANGNILSMKQMGLKVGGSDVIDDLTYTYVTNSVTNQTTSNRLQNVIDAKSDAQTTLGDFHYSAAYTTALTSGKSNTTVDYEYDGNGNLTKDKNKDIASITYNYLNLPAVVTVTGKGTITYIYDAVGNKLEKRTVDNTKSASLSTTTYIGGFVYQNNALQFFGHEEGRVRKAADGVSYTYDYFIKDHLGNVRMMLTEEAKTDVYPTLDFEGTAGTPAVTNQDAVWDNSTGQPVDVAGTRTAFNMGNSTTNGTYSKLIKKQSAGGAIGAAKLLKVMSGDQINTSVDYYWPSATVNNSHADGIGTLTTSLLSILASTTGVSSSVKGAVSTVNSGLSADPNIISRITNPENNTSGSTQPKAYLHVLLFNEQFQLDNANSYVLQIRTTSNVKDNLSQVVNVKKNGYAYVYFSNESDNDVYFDNFKLTHVRGQILQESHYSPWGLKLEGISSQAMTFGGATNLYLYNGKEQQSQEFSDDGGLDLYDYGARMYDAQLGRWGVIDPLVDKSSRWSPYNYAYDNPIRFIDPDGMEGQDASDDNEEVKVKYLLNTKTGKITIQQVSEDEYEKGTNGGTKNVVNSGDSGSTSNSKKDDKQIIINGVSASNQKETKTIAIINNPWINATVNTSFKVPNGFKPITINASDIISEITHHDAYMISIAADGALGGGYGGAIDIVLLNKGDEKGLYIYGAGDLNVGLNAGVGIIGGAIDFNPSYQGKIGKESFAGWSFAISGGVGWFSGAYIRAYQDGKIHAPGISSNPPYLYSGILGGRGWSGKLQAGGLITWSYAAYLNGIKF